MKSRTLGGGASSLTDKAEKALRQAVREAIKDHARTGDPVYFWRDGKIVKVFPARFLHKRSPRR